MFEHDWGLVAEARISAPVGVWLHLTPSSGVNGKPDFDFPLIEFSGNPRRPPVIKLQAQIMPIFFRKSKKQQFQQVTHLIA